MIGTLGRECLDQLIALNEQHFRSVLSKFQRYYNLGPTASDARVTNARAEATPHGRSDPVTAGIKRAHHITSAPPERGAGFCPLYNVILLDEPHLSSVRRGFGGARQPESSAPDADRQMPERRLCPTNGSLHSFLPGRHHVDGQAA